MTTRRKSAAQRVFERSKKIGSVSVKVRVVNGAASARVEGEGARDFVEGLKVVRAALRDAFDLDHVLPSTPAPAPVEEEPREIQATVVSSRTIEPPQLKGGR